MTSLRLVNGTAKEEGNVVLNGRPICDDGWSVSAAGVLCRMLGFPGAHAATGESFFGQAPPHFIATAVHCLGDEETILDCTYSTNVNDCTNGEVSGVICQSKYFCTVTA